MSIVMPWQRELAQAFTDPVELGQALQLPPDWIQAHAPARKLFPLRVPRPFVRLMQPGDPADPLLRQVWPMADEYEEAPGFSTDPLAEQQAEAGQSLLHKYRNRILVILRGGCAVNCRYCFRRHFPYADHHFGRPQQQELISYLAAHPEINEVILSGGDPLMAQDHQLLKLIEALGQQPQLRRLRIHSRLPVVIPERLTLELATALSKSPLQTILVIHSNHPRELSQHLRKRLNNWRKQGIWLLNQAVLLKGVNDCDQTQVALSEALARAQVQPYYLHQLDKVQGAAHFGVSDDRARAIARAMHKNLPGFLVPKLVREIPGEPGKTPLDLQLEP